VQDQQTANIVEKSLDLADRLDINAIPAFLINDKLITGALSEQRLDRLIQAAIDEETE